jgi:hypothetical protein
LLVVLVFIVPGLVAWMRWPTSELRILLGGEDVPAFVVIAANRFRFRSRGWAVVDREGGVVAGVAQQPSLLPMLGAWGLFLGPDEPPAVVAVEAREAHAEMPKQESFRQSVGLEKPAAGDFEVLHPETEELLAIFWGNSRQRDLFLLEFRAPMDERLRLMVLVMCLTIEMGLRKYR